jgi:selenobiotic family peptide radical SAM maturase
VSLEGLKDYNDLVRGQGHFERTLEFLVQLRERRIVSHVMLTLPDQNCDQVLPLATALRGYTDHFTFNRLSQVGAGTAVVPCTGSELLRFYDAYLEARDSNPALRLKDNLLNCRCLAAHRPTFGGCTGYGCGAAFNFLALLPDGELHACRKFPSPVGHVIHDSLRAAYASQKALTCRAGCRVCRGCSLRNVCGGCMAIAYGRGQDPLEQRDPDCML